MPNPGPILVAVLAVLLILGVSTAVAVQARRRGYNLLVWLLAGALGNPFFLLAILAIMPDWARKEQRRRETAELEAKLKRSPLDRAGKLKQPLDREFRGT